MQAYKFELMPHGQQQRNMWRFAGVCRFVFNKALAWQKEQYASDQTIRFSYTVLANLLPSWKQDPNLAWLKESPSQALQQTLKDLERACNNFFSKRSDFPRFKTTISQNHALVCIEDLQVRNMSKSSKGTIDQLGKMVKQKSGLNRAILDQGWGEFRRQLEYKVGWQGGILLAVPAHHTSQTCPACGHVSKDKRLTQARLECMDCGYENHADVVGAINILERGHRLLACGELVQSDRSVKQEPTEATRKSSRTAVGIPVLSAQAAVID